MSRHEIEQLEFEHAIDLGYAVFAHARLNGNGRVADFCIYKDGTVAIYQHGEFHRLPEDIAESVKSAITHCRIIRTRSGLEAS